LVQLVTRRSALVLYGVLLVLPTIVLGGLLWRQLMEDHDAEMLAIPDQTTNAARRLSDQIELRLKTLVEHENQRPFYYYKRLYFQPETIGAVLAFVPSPLVKDRVPEGILGWFAYSERFGYEPEVEIFGGNREQDPEWAERRAELEASTLDLAAGDLDARREDRVDRVGSVRVDPLPMSVAAINVSQEQDIECLKREVPALRSLEKESLDVRVSSFNLRFYVEPNGTPRIVATRRVRIDANPLLLAMPACFDRLGSGLRMTQGFYIDPDWFFSRLPKSLARAILDPSQEFIAAGAGSRESQAANFRYGYNHAILAEIFPVRDLEIQTFQPEDESFGHLRIVGNTADLEERYLSQTRHILGVLAMLVLSLATGLALLLRSVRRDLDAAQRTENFVAAVTHELRTPLSAIRMHGEMLKEGWVHDEGKRQEYYRRIVRETDRLETLVERVLEKSRLATTDAAPEPGDVNALVEGLGPALIGSGTEQPSKDVVFDLAPELPSAMVVPEGVRSIVTNLVENARKYAPVDVDAPGAEPIRVATLLAEEGPTLEVRDRGPGIPREERARIFDAFYRLGNETTRTAKGTGLGLHLAALHCDGMGARIQALDRDGGGTVFRVTFQRA